VKVVDTGSSVGRVEGTRVCLTGAIGNRLGVVAEEATVLVDTRVSNPNDLALASYSVRPDWNAVPVVALKDPRTNVVLHLKLLSPLNLSHRRVLNKHQNRGLHLRGV